MSKLRINGWKWPKIPKIFNFVMALLWVEFYGCPHSITNISTTILIFKLKIWEYILDSFNYNSNKFQLSISKISMLFACRMMGWANFCHILYKNCFSHLYEPLINWFQLNNKYFNLPGWVFIWRSDWTSILPWRPNSIIPRWPVSESKFSLEEIDQAISCFNCCKTLLVLLMFW